MINTLCDVIWQGIRYSIAVIHGNPMSMPYANAFSNELDKNSFPLSTNTNAVESRYSLENQLMQAVS